MRLRFLLSIFLALYNVVDATAVNLEGRQSGNGASVLIPDVVQLVQKAVDNGTIPGLAVAIVYKNKPAEYGTWGYKYENGTKMTPDTLFNLASCSKAFLATSIGIVMDDFAHGRNTTPLPAGLSGLSWGDKVVDILGDDWKLMDPWASEKASLIDIFSHVSGLSRNDFSYRSTDTVSSLTRNLRNLRPTYEFREEFQYNNEMYIVGSYIVSKLTGMRYVDFVDKRIFKPLGMTSSTYSIDGAVRSGKFTGTWTYFGRYIPPWLEEEYVDLMAGAAGVISSVEDLALWNRMYLNGGVDPKTNATIISPKNLDVITTGHSIESASSAEISTYVYGAGWERFSVFGHDFISHTGAGPGVSTQIAAALEDGFGIVALVNADAKADAIQEIVLGLAQQALGLGYKPPAPANNSVTSRSISPRHVSAGVTARVDRRGAPSYPQYPDPAGTYSSAGYGTLVLCSARTSIPACKNIQNDVRALNGSLWPKSPDLFTDWGAVWYKHGYFSYTNGSSYEIDIGTIYPQGYGKNTTPFALTGEYTTAEFVVEDGQVIGFGFNDSASVLPVNPAGSVKETSQVWFDRTD
ncbi:beta-lactamase/transpeptidase-like protein [Russula aff. rugulosa BPL654]|nr:beta-lactamase/transpeptidase-like protein [Russula aff. rugulosa BPL654]